MDHHYRRHVLFHLSAACADYVGDATMVEFHAAAARAIGCYHLWSGFSGSSPAFQRCILPADRAAMYEERLVEEDFQETINRSSFIITHIDLHLTKFILHLIITAHNYQTIFAVISNKGMIK